MRLANHPLLSRLLAGLALSAGLAGVLTSAAAAATAKPMPGMDGWMRLAPLSPNPPPGDGYLDPLRSPPPPPGLATGACRTGSPDHKRGPRWRTCRLHR